MFDHDSNLNMQNSAMNMAEQPPFLAIGIMRQQWTTTCSLLFVELIRVHREYHGKRICERNPWGRVLGPSTFSLGDPRGPLPPRAPGRRTDLPLGRPRARPPGTRSSTNERRDRRPNSLGVELRDLTSTTGDDEADEQVWRPDGGTTRRTEEFRRRPRPEAERPAILPVVVFAVVAPCSGRGSAGPRSS